MNELTTQNENFKISPNFKVRDWKIARDDNNWQTMVNIFHDRLNGRYLKPIKLIAKDADIGEFSGFSILSLDCLVIETLHQFYNGLPETKQGKGEVESAFVNFFIQSEFFNDSFTRETARIFYLHFRCGLLHQAQTKEKSLIKINQKSMVSIVTTSHDDGLIVDRMKFHDALENEINCYMKLLEENKDDVLRKNFIKKINCICNLPDNQ